MKKIIFVVIVVLLMVFGWERCVYDFVAPEETDIDTTVVVSFSSQIQPIFTANCILCHKTGGTSPDLTSGNAYNSINSSKYINTSTPSQSLLYRRASPTGGFSGHPNVSPAQAALLLTWIQQGAKNN